MKRRKLKNIFGKTIILFAFLFLTSSLFAGAADQTVGQTSVGGLFHFPWSNTTGIGNLVKQIYLIALGIVGALALGMIIFGGLQYSMSAGDPSRQRDARDRITQALWGVVLLLSAYLILKTINPELVNLKEPNLGTVPPAPAITAPTVEGEPDMPRTFPIGPSVGGTLIEIPPSLKKKPDIPGHLLKEGLINKLIDFGTRAFQNNRPWKGQGWQITEAIPPSFPHISSCHQENNRNTGTCADANFVNPPSDIRTRALWINQFIYDAYQSGLGVIYEVKTQEEKNSIVSNLPEGSTGIADRIRVNPNISAAHFHINMNR